MLSMGLKSRSSTSSTVVTSNGVELVTATKGLEVRTFVILPLTYSHDHELITRLEFQLAYSEKLVAIRQGTPIGLLLVEVLLLTSPTSLS